MSFIFIKADETEAKGEIRSGGQSPPTQREAARLADGFSFAASLDAPVCPPGSLSLHWTSVKAAGSFPRSYNATHLETGGDSAP